MQFILERSKLKMAVSPIKLKSHGHQIADFMKKINAGRKKNRAAQENDDTRQVCPARIANFNN